MDGSKLVLKDHFDISEKQRVQLRKAEESDLLLLHGWFNSEPAFGEFDQPISNSFEQTRHFWISGLNTSLRIILFNGKEIGFTDMNVNSDEEDNVRITVIIALPEFRGKGIGTIVHRLLCEEIFRFNSQILSIEAWTDVDNWAEKNVLQKVGFVQRNHLKKAWKLREEHRDMIVFRLERLSRQ